MIRIAVSASKKYDVIMDEGALGRMAELMAQAGLTAGGAKTTARAGGAGFADSASRAGDTSHTNSASRASGAEHTNSASRAGDTSHTDGRKLCIVSDKTIAGLYGGKSGALYKSLAAAGFDICEYVFEGGEKHKTMDTVTDILNYLADNRFTRSDLLLALGGGITGDVTGFAASAYMRGIEFVQVPTTLLATVDSSVGGKTGVNLRAGKNLAGAFWQPSLVVFDPAVLDTLSDHLLLDGLAEALKAGFIGDPSMIEAVASCSDIRDHGFLTDLSAKAIRVKKSIVEEDEREKGNRQLLNFGHTLAHAIEKCSDYAVSHGHAVATGMAIVAAAADALGWSEIKCSAGIVSILSGLGFSLDCPYGADELTAAALSDKKVRGGDITLVIPQSPGVCVLRTIPTERLNAFISCGIEQLKGIHV